MDYTFEKEWGETIERISKTFGEKLDYSAILFLIGVQETGMLMRKFKKDEKLELMHVAICRLLEPFGYYSFKGNDEDGWPHFDKQDDLPVLTAPEQELLVKKAIVGYFRE